MAENNTRTTANSTSQSRHRSVDASKQSAPTVNLPKVLRIGIIQNGKIVEERIIRKRDTVTVGPSEKCTFVISQQDVPTSRFELFETRGGPYLLNFLPEMQGRVSLAGKVIELSEAIKGKEVENKGKHYSLTLDEQSRGKVVLGETTVLFQFVAPPPIQPRPQLPAAVKGSVFDGVELFISVCFAVSLIFHASLISYFMFHDWPALTMEEKLARLEELLNSGQATFDKPKADDKGEGEKGEEEEEEEADEDDKNKKPDKAPEEEAEDTGPKKSAEEIAAERAARRAELAEQIAQRGINKILGSIGGDGEGAVADVLRGGDVGADQDDLLSQVNGVGVATGDNGGNLKGPAGGKGSGEAADISQLKVAGGDKTVNTAGPGPEKKISGNVRKKEPIASGGTGMMSSSDVADVVNRKIGAIKGCYEQALKRDPGLKGKVTIRFTISGAGKVTTARPTLNELNGAVGDCISGAFMRFRFPPPEGGTVTFEYPFLFTPAN